MTETYLIVSESRDKGKEAVAVFLDFLYENCRVHKCEEYIIWSGRATPEFKIKFIFKFLPILSQKCQHPFLWK